MNTKDKLKDAEDSHEEPVKETTDGAADEAEFGEFKVTVRKLEVPVRPRGVLAE
jgi:hypothetical protein